MRGRSLDTNMRSDKIALYSASRALDLVAVKENLSSISDRVS